MVYKQKADQCERQVLNVRGGEGSLIIKDIVNAPEELLGKGRALNVTTLNPGVTIGMHQHIGEMELMYGIAGSFCNLSLAGNRKIIRPGDLIIVEPGESHAVEACTGEPAVYLTMCLYK